MSIVALLPLYVDNVLMKNTMLMTCQPYGNKNIHVIHFMANQPGDIHGVGKANVRCKLVL